MLLLYQKIAFKALEGISRKVFLKHIKKMEKHIFAHPLLIKINILVWGALITPN